MYSNSHLNFETYRSLLNVHNRNLVEWGVRRNAYVIPVAAELRGSSDAFLDICHLTTAGIEKKASIIADHLGKYIAVKYPALGNPH